MAVLWTCCALCWIETSFCRFRVTDRVSEVNRVRVRVTFRIRVMVGILWAENGHAYRERVWVARTVYTASLKTTQCIRLDYPTTWDIPVASYSAAEGIFRNTGHLLNSSKCRLGLGLDCDHAFSMLYPVYTIQPVVKPVNRLDNRLYRVNKHPTGCQMVLTTGFTTGCIV